MENQKSNSNMKIIIGVLAIAFLASLGYIFKLSSDTQNLEKTVVTVKSEKDTMMKDLENLKASYDEAIAENTSMSDELKAEREKVVKLMDDLKSAKGDAAAMAKYKQRYQELDKKMKSLMEENEVLKSKNESLTKNLDSTNVVLEDSKKYSQTVVAQNEELAKTVEKGSKLVITNLKTSSYKQRSSGKQIDTDKAGRADGLKISFTIAENSIAKSGDKTYYVQVIDSKNNVLGDKATETFGDNTLTYSFTTVVKYDNKSVNVTHDLPGKDFAKGTYFVNVFDKGELVSKSSFNLR